MNGKILFQHNMLDLLGFRVHSYSDTNGEVSGFNEINETSFTLPPKDLLTVLGPQIRALLGAQNNDVIMAAVNQKGRQVRFSENAIRGIPTEEMTGKSFSELRASHIWSETEALKASRMFAGATGTTIATVKELTLIGGNDSYVITSTVIPIDGNKSIAFFTNKLCNPMLIPRSSHE